ncbi:haloacid dehalogenase [Sorangium cellulosum]|uniref:Beta-phosphoglucomutase n=1 Tax=Sorangium cellulosum TaxID=56 RepID=A0A2L0ETZ5_SORCE|nr:HAD family phosphatase [Sorangium cellulosum]AUX42749.1 haloacid dehalogenase [Sorangium cellulosum]
MPQSPTKAVLWDLDGTLVDSSELHFIAWREALAAEGRPYGRADHDAVFGMRNDDLLRRLLDPEISGAEVARIAGAKERHYRQLVAASGIEPLPGVRTWLSALAAAGFRMAIASSAPRENLDVILAAAQIEGVFDAVISSEEVSHGKPHPAVFLRAAERVGVPPSRCVVVEDAPAGVLAGKRGGMKVIGVGPRHGELGADVSVERLDQLPVDTFERLLPQP